MRRLGAVKPPLRPAGARPQADLRVNLNGIVLERYERGHPCRCGVARRQAAAATSELLIFEITENVVEFDELLTRHFAPTTALQSQY
jgi:hypothetical protein